MGNVLIQSAEFICKWLSWNRSSPKKAVNNTIPIDQISDLNATDGKRAQVLVIFFLHCHTNLIMRVDFFVDCLGSLSDRIDQISDLYATDEITSAGDYYFKHSCRSDSDM